MKLRNASQAITPAVLIFIILMAHVPMAKPSSSALIWSDERQFTYDPTYTYEDPETGKNITEYYIYFDIAPSVMATQDNKVWIAWQTDEFGEDEIFYKILNGTWSDKVRITHNANYDMGPAILQTSDHKIWVFWTSDRTGNNEIFYKVTSNFGASWSADTQATDDTRSDQSPTVIQANDGKMWLVWSRRTGTSNKDLFYKTFDGTTWSDEFQLTTNTNLDESPSVVQAKDERIWVFWSQYMPDTHYQICYTKSSDGSTWSSEAQLTTEPKDNMSPAALVEIDGTMWVFWQSKEQRTQATFDLFYACSFSNGSSWSSFVQFTADREDDIQPAVTQAPDKSIWVFWASNRLDSNGNDNVDLYQKTTLLGDVNKDGIVDIADMDIIKRALLTTPADPPGTGWDQWNPECDLNVDNIIDVQDLATASVNFGRQASG